MKILIIILLSLMVIPVYAIQEPLVLDATCTLILLEPYYDCSRPLFIIMFDQEFPPKYDNTNDTWYEQELTDEECCSYGTSYRNMVMPNHWDNPARYKHFDMIVVGYMQDQKNVGKYDINKNMTVLQHELQHIKCKCTWHAK